MNAGGFGRRGTAGGIGPGGGARPQFGRPVDMEADAIAARRAAFLAEERTRAAHSESGGGRPGAPYRSGTGGPAIGEKKLSTAYALWFFLGGLAVHRFYLGCPISGAIQAGLAPIGYALLVSGSLIGFLFLFMGGLWILADGFIVPSLYREANDRARQRAMEHVFA